MDSPIVPAIEIRTPVSVAGVQTGGKTNAL